MSLPGKANVLNLRSVAHTCRCRVASRRSSFITSLAVGFGLVLVLFASQSGRHARRPASGWVTRTSILIVNYVIVLINIVLTRSKWAAREASGLRLDDADVYSDSQSGRHARRPASGWMTRTSVLIVNYDIVLINIVLTRLKWAAREASGLRLDDADVCFDSQSGRHARSPASGWMTRTSVLIVNYVIALINIVLTRLKWAAREASGLRLGDADVYSDSQSGRHARSPASGWMTRTSVLIVNYVIVLINIVLTRLKWAARAASGLRLDDADVCFDSQNGRHARRPASGWVTRTSILIVNYVIVLINIVLTRLKWAACEASGLRLDDADVKVGGTRGFRPPAG
ncbi:hypothetical protein EVAR_34612_1 [Eumeta japonica]|uniref:Uncharacterized protein n=1 Tax=Eumeta variegata TaxID=151549 RepID=A0A4C1VH03_EUMVA|nr:hypothetical protein EVAR_34612_1 [Eumeta japonica]